MYGAAWVVVLYTALRYLALTRHHHTYGDSYGYHTAARLPFFSVDFWAGLRSFTIPLFWRLLGNDEGLTVGVQFAISVVCWLALAWAVAGLSNVRVVRWLAYVLVLGLSLTEQVALWDMTLLSESLSFSGLVLLTALAIRLLQRPRYATLASALVVALLWVFARDSNVYLAVAVIPMLVAGLFFAKRQRTLIAVALAGTIAILGLSSWNASHGSRAANPVEFVVKTRLPQDNPAALVWMRAHGYTTPNAPNTVSVFRKYLLLHPGEFLTAVFRDDPTYAPWPANERRLPALYTPDISLYQKSEPRWRLPQTVQRVLQPPAPRWLILELAVVAVLVGAAFRQRRPGRMWLVPATLVAGAYPQLVVLWGVNGLETDRHALGTAVEIRLALIMALVLALTTLVPLWRARVAVQAPAPLPAPPPPAAKELPLRRLPTRFEALIILLLLVGLAGRIAFWVSPFGVPDADEAVGGLMALHALHLNSISVFYWGQAYGGPLETWLAAPLVGALGTNYLALRLVPTVLSAVAAFVVWRVGLRTTSRTGAALAGALAWCFPSFLLWKMVHFHIFYASGILLGMLVLLQALRLTERATTRRALLLGILSGLALWQSFQLIAIVPATLGWLFVRRRDLARYIPVTAAGAVVALLPVLISNLRHDWWSRDIGHPGNELWYPGRLWQLFTNTLPIALDLRTAVTLDWFAWKPVGLALYVAVLVGFVWLWRASRPGRPLERAEVLVVIALVFPFVYAISPLTTVGDMAGYVIVFVPVIALLLTAWIRTTRQAAGVAAAALVLMAGTALRLHHEYGTRDAGQFTHLGTHVPLPRDFTPLYDELDRLGIRRVYASYWIAHRISYETGERIIAGEMRPEALRAAGNGAIIPLPNDPDLVRRRPEYGDIVGRVPFPAFVIVKRFDPPSTDYEAFRTARYATREVGPFTIYYRPGLSEGVGVKG